MSSPSAPRGASRRPAATLLAGAFGGGFAFGLGDGLRAIFADTGLVPAGSGAGVVVVNALAVGLGALAVGAPGAPWLARRLRAPGAAGLLLGLAGAAAGMALLAAITRPPSFVGPAPPRTDALSWAVGALVLGLLAGWAGRRGAPRAALAATLALPIAWAGSGRAPAAARGQAPAQAPNVLLVTLDTTRADATSLGGAPEARTKNLALLYSQGLRFSAATAQIPVTNASHATLMSGLGPWAHGVLLNGVPVPADVPLLAQALRAAGWRTGAFVSSFVVSGEFGLSRGFSVYDDSLDGRPGWKATLLGRAEARLRQHLDPDQVVERRGDRTVDRALSWLNQKEDGPFFAWVHLFDPHGPYAPPEPWDRAWYQGDPRDPANDSMAQVTGVASYLKPSLDGITDVDWVRAQYAGEVSFADAQLGRLLAWLDGQGLTQDTLVVVAGDHGESLGEHGIWFNHGDDLFAPATSVPLVMRLPGRVPAGQTVSSPVELTDVAPTVLGLLGLPAPAGADGVDLGPWIQDPGRSSPPRLFARALTYDRPANLAARRRGETERPVWKVAALRAPSGRYVLREAPGEAGGRWYDAAADPDERRPTSPPDELAGLLEAEAARLIHAQPAGEGGAPRPATAAPMDAATEDKLRALGYIDE